jgi:hypothetical protein
LQKTVQRVFYALVWLLWPLFFRAQSSSLKPVFWPRGIVLYASPQLVQCSREEARADFPERLSYDSYALLSPVWQLHDAIALVELNPSLEELGLIRDLGYSCLGDIEGRIGSGKAIAPEF